MVPMDNYKTDKNVASYKFKAAVSSPAGPYFPPKIKKKWPVGVVFLTFSAKKENLELKKSAIKTLRNESECTTELISKIFSGEHAPGLNPPPHTHTPAWSRLNGQTK